MGLARSARFVGWLCTAAAVGCDDAAAPAQPTNFESELVEVPTSDSAPPLSAAPSAGAPGWGASDLQLLASAELYQLQGTRLYTLSSLAGLSVIDVSEPSQLRVIGRKAFSGDAIALEVRAGVALVVIASAGTLAGAPSSVLDMSQLLALDVEDPSQIRQLRSLDIPGRISAAHSVGDRMYLVSQEDSGNCSRCADSPRRTSIVSVRVDDPREPTSVSQLSYDYTDFGPRSVVFGTDHVYVAGPERGDGVYDTSTLQVIDISDSRGELMEGPSIALQGLLFEGWQLNEHNAVLRVVLQPARLWDGSFSGAQTPVLATYRIESSQALSELGRTELQLPEDYRGSFRVRFDAERGYISSSYQKPRPLALELSDPAQPRQVGELPLPPGYYTIEPHGDRLFAMGYDPDKRVEHNQVLLFDVSSLEEPKQLSQVSFGGEEQWLSTGAEHFRVSDELGLVMVSYAGALGTVDGCYPNGSLGGLQLIDYENDTLKLRGAVTDQQDGVRPTWLLDDTRLLSASAKRVAAVDLRDRAKPEALSEVVLARDMKYALQLEGDVVARISAVDQGDHRLDFVRSRDAADLDARYAELNLTQTAFPGGEPCSKAFYVETTFVRGSTLELLYSGHGEHEDMTGLLVIDASDPSKPEVVSNVQWASNEWRVSRSFEAQGFFGYAPAVVRTERALVLLEEDGGQRASWTPENAQHRLRVLDLRDGQSTFVALAQGQNVHGLAADDDHVLTSHAEPTADGQRGKFYIDRIDVSDPAAPERTEALNVPGRLIGVDAASGKVLTSEQLRVPLRDGISAEACLARFANAQWSDGCVAFRQRVSLLRIEAGTVVVEDQLDLSEDQQIFAITPADGVMFASVTHGHDGAQPAEMQVLSGFARGRLHHADIAVPTERRYNLFGPWGWPAVYPYGDRALLAGWGELAVVDISDPEQPQVGEKIPVSGAVQSAEIHAGRALLALGDIGTQGVVWLDLGD